MRLKRQALLIVSLMMFAVCATASDSPEKILRTLPTAIEGFIAKPVYIYDQPGAGASIGYNFNGGALTLFLYNNGEKIEDGITSNLILDHKDAVVNEIKRGKNWSNVSIINDAKKDIELANGKRVQVLFTQFTLEDSANSTSAPASLRSDLYLLGTKGNICKIRITRPTNTPETKEQTIEKVVAELFSKILD